MRRRHSIQGELESCSVHIQKLKFKNQNSKIERNQTNGQTDAPISLPFRLIGRKRSNEQCQFNKCDTVAVFTDMMSSLTCCVTCWCCAHRRYVVRDSTRTENVITWWESSSVSLSVCHQTGSNSRPINARLSLNFWSLDNSFKTFDVVRWARGTERRYCP